MSNKSVREPLFHVAKRGYVPKYKSWAIRLGSIVAALLVCAVVTMLLTGENPISVYKTMFEGAFGTERKIWKLLQSRQMLQKNQFQQRLHLYQISLGIFFQKTLYH